MDRQEIIRIPMDRAYSNLKRAIKAEGNKSPDTFYQAYYFIETFSYNDSDLKALEQKVEDDVKSEKIGSEAWRNLHDVLHAIKAQKRYNWD